VENYMEFMNRSQRPADQTNGAEAQPVATTNTQPAQARPMASAMSAMTPKVGSSKLRFALVALLFSATFLIASSLAYIAFSSNRSKPTIDKLYNAGRYQALFLDGGQAYVGKVTVANEGYLQLKDVYYLRVEQNLQGQTTQQQQSSVSLAKLGCDIYGMEDALIIDRSKVVFWSDLKEAANSESGAVIKAVEEYKKTSGGKCPSGAQATNPAAPSTTTPTTTTPATTAPVTTPPKTTTPTTPVR
jgi:hypothetical protein